MAPVTRLTLGVVLSLALVGGTQSETRGDDSFRCGTNLVELGDAPSAVERACGRPTDIRKTKGHVRNARGSVMRIEYETWTYNLGPVTFARILVFSDGSLTSITTDDYGG